MEEETQPEEARVSERKRKAAKIRKMRNATPGSTGEAKGLDGTTEMVSLDDIDQSNTMFQCRLSMPVADVRRSLKHDGLEQPIDLLGPKPYRIIDGLRRCKAAHELGWKSIRAIVHAIDDKQALRVAFTKNVVRKNLAPMDKANALWLAQKQGFKKAELLDTFDISQKQVDRYLAMLDFSVALQKCIDGKVVTMAHAKALHDYGVDSPAEWKKRIEAEKLGAKQLKKLLRTECGKKQPGRRKLYLKKSKDGMRVYPFSISKDMPQAEKDKIARLLREALELLAE